VASQLQSELIVNVQGDEPLIVPHAIDDVVAVLEDRPADLMATLRRRIDDPADLADPGVVKLVVDHQGYALYFSRAPIPFVRPLLINSAGADVPPTAWRHTGLYVYRREFLRDVAALAPTPLEQAEGLEQLRVLEHGFRIATVETTVDTVGVDTPEDLERVRRLVEAGARP
jgi:3-deoxy-manno-octulosonate cytidylyltransferase (CMP-KDO synthetase)